MRSCLNVAACHATLVFSLFAPGQQAFGISAEMVEQIGKFVLASTGESIDNYSNNMREIMQRQCGGTSACSDRQICQILNLGAYFPRDCTGLSDQPVVIDPAELAFSRFLASLPEPRSCVEFAKELAKTGQNGQLIIVLDDSASMPTSTLGAQCQQERRNLRLPYLENKEEVLRLLGYPLSDARIDQIFQRVLNRRPDDKERQWTRDFINKGGSSQDITTVLYLSLDLIGANGRTISLENIYFQYLKQSRNIEKVVEVLLGVDKTVYTYTWNEAERTCTRSPRSLIVKNQKCGKAERQIKIMGATCDVSYDGEYRFTLKGGQDDCPEAPLPLSGPIEPGIYQIKSAGERCLDIRDASNTEGARLQLMPCVNKLNQMFSLNNISGEAYTVTAWHSQQCVEGDASNSLVQRACSFLRSQNIRFVPSTNGTFTIQLAKSGFCIDSAGGNTLQASCTGSESQKWSFVKADPFSNPLTTIPTDVSYEIVGGFSQKCLAVKSDKTLQQWQCSGSVEQTFRFQDAGNGLYQLKTADSGKCVRADAGKKDNGTRMVLTDCGSGQDQRLRLEASDNETYKLRFAHSQKCLDVAGTSADNGLEVHQWDCGEAPDQKWLLSENGPTSIPVTTALCQYKHKEDTKGGKKGEVNFSDATGKAKSCVPTTDWKTSCKDGDGKTDELACHTSSKPSVPALCQYKHKKDNKGGKKGQTNAFDVNGKQKSCDRSSDWKTSCKDGNGDTDEVDCQ